MDDSPESEDTPKKDPRWNEDGVPVKNGVPIRQGVRGPSSTGRVNPVVDQSTWRKKMQTSRIKFDDIQKEVYLSALAEHSRKGDAARAAGVSTMCVKNHVENDPDFAEAVEEALNQYRDKFVAKAIGELAYEGVEIKKFDKEGNLIESRRDYPVNLIAMELRRIDAGFRDKQQIDLNTGGGVMVAEPVMSEEEFAEQEEKHNLTRQPPGTMIDVTPTKVSD